MLCHFNIFEILAHMGNKVNERMKIFVRRVEKRSWLAPAKHAKNCLKSIIVILLRTDGQT